jgi:hypothetical protein
VVRARVEGEDAIVLGAGLLESGSVQFIIFVVMVVAIFIALFITIAK